MLFIELIHESGLLIDSPLLFAASSIFMTSEQRHLTVVGIVLSVSFSKVMNKLSGTASLFSLLLSIFLSLTSSSSLCLSVTLVWPLSCQSPRWSYLHLAAYICNIIPSQEIPRTFLRRCSVSHTRILINLSFNTKHLANEK